MMRLQRPPKERGGFARGEERGGKVEICDSLHYFWSSHDADAAAAAISEWVQTSSPLSSLKIPAATPSAFGVKFMSFPAAENLGPILSQFTERRFENS